MMKLISCTGKVSRRNKFYINILDRCHFKRGRKIEKCIGEEEKDAFMIVLCFMLNRKNWLDLKTVYTEVIDSGQLRITRWIFTDKVVGGKVEKVTRLVVKGF